MNAPSPAIAAAALYPYQTLSARLKAIAAEFPHAAFASSLGAEDMVVTDAILSGGLPIAIFTLETGRLPPETLDLLERVRSHYAHEIEAFRPDPDAVGRYVKEHGLNAFYESVDLRKRCCH
ncbi:MAG TPA: phosphoadenosine phosphosulfate reductase family protein, partial [Burkholderiales bacterium]|nr:phosphoadenosine phosphosulfate reductase family protein [Burkholderiales bacterium]